MIPLSLIRLIIVVGHLLGKGEPLQSNKLQLVLASTVILAFESHGTHDHYSLTDLEAL
jgi:hypothetical protein